MTSRERVVTTLNHKKADMLPVDYLFEDYRTVETLAKRMSMTIPELYDYVGVDIMFLDVMDEIQKFIRNPYLMDYTFNNGFARRDENDPAVAYDRWGIGWRMDSDGERPQTHCVIESVDDIAAYKVPDPLVEGEFHDIDKRLPELNAQGKAVTVGQYYGLFEKGWLLMGYEDFMVDCYTEKESIHMLLDKILEYRLKVSKEIIKRDIAFGHSGDDYGTQRGPIMSLEMWREYFKPRLKQIWAVYKDAGLPVVHHSCGDCSLYIDDMLEIGLDALHPIQSCMDIEALSKRYGDNLVFYGGIDCQNILVNGTPEDVRNNVKRAVELLGKKGNMVLSPVNVMHDVRLENFEALVESVKEYRQI